MVSRGGVERGRGGGGALDMSSRKATAPCCNACCWMTSSTSWSLKKMGETQGWEKFKIFETIPSLARARVLGAGRTTAALQVLFCVTKRCPLFWCHMLSGIKVGFFF